MLSEVCSGIASGLVVSPAMTVLDMAIIKSQIHIKPLHKSMAEIVRSAYKLPLSFAQPLSVMIGVYSATYTIANCTKSYCSRNGIDYKTPTVVATSIVNVAALAYKDAFYSKVLGNKVLKIPRMSYLLFAVRDGMTITSSFVLKYDVMDTIQKLYGVSHTTADIVVSFAVPMTMQLFSTPIHIYAIDVYSRPNETIVSRLSHVRKHFTHVCFGRMLRIVPAFGVGGVINDMLQKTL